MQGEWPKYCTRIFEENITLYELHMYQGRGKFLWISYSCNFLNVIMLNFQAQCQSLKINNCPQLIFEFGAEAVRRDNICKTQCSFALNSPGFNFDPSSDQLQAPVAFPNAFAARPFRGGQQQQQQLRKQQNGQITQPIRGPIGGQQGLGFGTNVRQPAVPIPPSQPVLPRAPRPPQASSTLTAPPQVPLNNLNLQGGGRLTTQQQQQLLLQQQQLQQQQQQQQNNPNRQARPLFNFLPRLPNLSELFGL